jgi:hypothetical protein
MRVAVEVTATGVDLSGLGRFPLRDLDERVGVVQDHVATTPQEATETSAVLGDEVLEHPLQLVPPPRMGLELDDHGDGHRGVYREVAAGGHGRPHILSRRESARGRRR